jgi:hypothetical protein
VALGWAAGLQVPRSAAPTGEEGRAGLGEAEAAPARMEFGDAGAATAAEP